MSEIKLLAFAGSLRKASYNKSLVKVAAKAAEAAGASVTYIDLNDYPLPFMDEDLEAESGVPENAQKLKALMKSHDGLLIASPEYNGSFSGVLKNVIDWCSRQEEGEKILECYTNKTVSIISASPGSLGGIRGLTQLRTLLSGLGCFVLPKQIAIGKAHEAFNDDGTLANPKQQANIEKLAATTVNVTKQLNNH